MSKGFNRQRRFAKIPSRLTLEKLLNGEEVWIIDQKKIGTERVSAISTNVLEEKDKYAHSAWETNHSAEIGQLARRRRLEFAAGMLTIILSSLIQPEDCVYPGFGPVTFNWWTVKEIKKIHHKHLPCANSTLVKQVLIDEIKYLEDRFFAVIHYAADQNQHLVCTLPFEMTKSNPQMQIIEQDNIEI